MAVGHAMVCSEQVFPLPSVISGKPSGFGEQLLEDGEGGSSETTDVLVRGFLA